MRMLPVRRYLRIAAYRLANARAGRHVWPFYCSFKITQRCGLRCAFCNIWKRPRPDLTTQQVFRILDNIGDSSVMVVSMEGGDPLMRNDLLEILKYARTKPFYLFFTTNGQLFDKRPMAELCKYIDFLHISIDEGHNNMELFDRLEDFKSWGAPICIQTVVTRDSLATLEDKVKKVHAAGVRTVIMPAVHMSDTDDFYPEPAIFAETVSGLKKKYPNTIITTDGFLRNIAKPNGCSTSSIIVDSDGVLFYPCHISENRAIDLTKVSLNEFLGSKEAGALRAKMAACPKRCGWYQYFATDSWAKPSEFFSAVKPYIVGRPVS